MLHRNGELTEGAVVLRATKEPRVRVAHITVDDEVPLLRVQARRLAHAPKERATPQLLRLERLAVHARRCRDGTLDRGREGACEVLPEHVGVLLEATDGRGGVNAGWWGQVGVESGVR